jgi:hypothetical protein
MQNYFSNNVFGYVGSNGLNFARSIHNPKSRLARVVRFVRSAGGFVTADEIITRGLGRKYPKNIDGRLLSLAVRNGFLTRDRGEYDLGPMAGAVKISAR